MDEIRSLAFISVGRPVLFSFFGIAMLILEFSFDPVLALKIGGSCSLILSLVLLQRSIGAERRPPRQTELWGMLAAERRPKKDDGSREISEILSLTYLGFARWTAGVTCLFFTAALVIGAIV